MPEKMKKVKKMQKKTGRKKEKRAWLNRNGRSGTSLAQSRKSPTPKLPSRRRGDLGVRRSSRSHVGGNRSRPPRRGAQGLAQEPPACTPPILPLPPMTTLNLVFSLGVYRRRPECLICSCCCCAGFRGEAGDAARRDGEPDDLALHHPRQARGKRPYIGSGCYWNPKP